MPELQRYGPVTKGARLSSGEASGCCDVGAVGKTNILRTFSWKETSLFKKGEVKIQNRRR